MPRYIHPHTRHQRECKGALDKMLTIKGKIKLLLEKEWGVIDSIDKRYLEDTIKRFEEMEGRYK